MSHDIEFNLETQKHQLVLFNVKEMIQYSGRKIALIILSPNKNYLASL